MSTNENFITQISRCCETWCHGCDCIKRLNTFLEFMFVAHFVEAAFVAQQSCATKVSYVIGLTSLCHPTTPGRSTLPAKHHHPTGFHRGWSVGVEFVAGLLPWSCCRREIRYSAYSALAISRLCLYKSTDTDIDSEWPWLTHRQTYRRLMTGCIQYNKLSQCS